MKTLLHTSLTLAAFALVLVPSLGSGQDVINGNNNNNFFRQNSNNLSVRGDTFNFFGGNDRLILLRNDDLAGLGDGVANMGDGRDVVITSFNMSGTFNLGNGDDFFLCEGDVNFNANFRDIAVNAGEGNDLIVVTTEFCAYGGDTGNDIFVSDTSGNFFDGGADNDTYSAEASNDPVRIDLGQGFAEGRFVSSADSLFNIENARGSNFNDTIFGNNNANRIDGLAGNDSINGDPGNDTISGGAGTNFLDGGAGIDTLVIEGTVASKSRSNSGVITVVGSFQGGAYNHSAIGFEQVLENGELKSVAFFLGLTNINTVQQTQIAESPVVDAINGFINGQTLNGNGNNNTITGNIGNDDIVGFAGNDTLNGRGGDDVILGGNGNDTINGGLGKDRLTGGANNDIFVFNTALSAGNADIITDYSVTQDTIHISRALVGNLPVGQLSAARFKRTSQGAIDGDDRIIYNSANGQLIFDSNGSAEGGSVIIATLPANLAMVAGEIVIR